MNSDTATQAAVLATAIEHGPINTGQVHRAARTRTRLDARRLIGLMLDAGLLADGDVYGTYEVTADGRAMLAGAGAMPA